MVDKKKKNISFDFTLGKNYAKQNFRNEIFIKQFFKIIMLSLFFFGVLCFYSNHRNLTVKRKKDL